jgi:UPF0271 protein
MDVQHVKPHGALYMVAARDEALSRAIIEAIRQVDPGLVLFCMEASVTYRLAGEMGQPVAAEFFADRAYNDEGQIVFTRKLAGELDPDEMAERTVRAVKEGRVATESGGEVEVRCDSVCVHSDTPGVARLAETIVRRLGENDVEVRAIGRSRERVS